MTIAEAIHAALDEWRDNGYELNAVLDHVNVLVNEAVVPNARPGSLASRGL
mgnify:FL=1